MELVTEHTALNKCTDHPKYYKIKVVEVVKLELKVVNMSLRFP